MNVLRHLEARTLEFFQRRCPHDDDYVTADMLDGDFHGGAGGEQQVEWCQRCGAARRVFDPFGQRRRYGDWREPRATWAEERI